MMGKSKQWGNLLSNSRCVKTYNQKEATGNYGIRIEQWRPKEINTQTYQIQDGKHQLNYII